VARRALPRAVPHHPPEGHRVSTLAPLVLFPKRLPLMTIDLWLSVLLVCCSSDLLTLPMDRFDPIGSCLMFFECLIPVAVDFDARTHGHRFVEITDH
jgi:hypothetical protein